MPESKTDKYHNSFLGVLVTIAIFVFAAITLQYFWAWYVASVFHVPVMTFAQAFGLWLLIRLIIPAELALSKLGWADVALSGIVKLGLLWLTAGIIHLL